MKKLSYGFVLLQLILLLGGPSRSYARSEENSKHISLEILPTSATSGETEVIGVDGDLLAPLREGKELFSFEISVFETEEEEDKLHSIKKWLETAITSALLHFNKSFEFILDADIHQRLSHTYSNPPSEPDYLVFQVFRL